MKTSPKKIRKAEEVALVKKSFLSIFDSSDILYDPFVDSVDEKVIIYYHPYILDETWYKSIAIAAKQLGENHAYISEIELYRASQQYKSQVEAYAKEGDSLNIIPRLEKFYSQDFEEYDHWLIDLTSYPYDGFHPVIENAFYSAHGTWGVIFSEIGFAIVGGSSSFFRALRAELPSLDSEIYSLLSYVNKDIQNMYDRTKWVWLPSLLDRIYGKEKSKDMLIRNSLGEIFLSK